MFNKASNLNIIDMWANYNCIILAEGFKTSRNVQNKKDII